MKGGGHCLAIDTRCLDTVTQHTETTIMTMTTDRPVTENTSTITIPDSTRILEL
jgi:hypothetical protein